MKEQILFRKSGEAVTVLIPENKADLAELQKLYDEGKLQAGDSVKSSPAVVQ